MSQSHCTDQGNSEDSSVDEIIEARIVAIPLY